MSSPGRAETLHRRATGTVDDAAGGSRQALFAQQRAVAGGAVAAGAVAATSQSGCVAIIAILGSPPSRTTPNATRPSMSSRPERRTV